MCCFLSECDLATGPGIKKLECWMVGGRDACEAMSLRDLICKMRMERFWVDSQKCESAPE